MRGAFIIGLVIVSLIVGVLVMKNMGAEKSGGITETQAKQYIEKAEKTADEVNSRLKDFNKRANSTQVD